MLNFGKEINIVMQRIILTIALSFSIMMAKAQVEKSITLESDNGNTAETSLDGLNAETSHGAQNAVLSSEAKEAVKPETKQDSIRYMPRIPRYMIFHPTIFTSYMPIGPFGWNALWDLHEGFNTQIGMGVMVGFGKHNPFKGASFYTDISLAYAKQLDEHWSVALGGGLSRFKMWNKNEWAGNVFALANYKFDEHWSASMYGSLNRMPEGFGMYNYDMFNDQCARIGGEVTYKFNEKFSVSVGVSTDIPTGNEGHPWKPMHGSVEQKRQNGRQ